MSDGDYIRDIIENSFKRFAARYFVDGKEYGKDVLATNRKEAREALIISLEGVNWTGAEILGVSFLHLSIPDHELNTIISHESKKKQGRNNYFNRMFGAVTRFFDRLFSDSFGRLRE